MFKKLLFIVVLIIGAAQLANACSCIPHGLLTIKDFNQQNTIFIGKVKSVTVDKTAGGYAQNGILFEVTTVFKGLSNRKDVKVYTNSSSAACGLTVGVGQRWLLYAHLFNGVLATNMCSRSQSLAYADAKELALLRSFVANEGNVWMSDDVKQAEGSLVNMLAEGAWKYYYTDGSLAAEGNYINGYKEGRWMEYVDVAALEERLKRNNILLTQDSLNQKDFQFKIAQITHYKAGKKQGEFVEYDPMSLKVTRIINFVADEKEGLSITYYPSGLIEREENYQKNELNGFARAYYANGQLMSEGKFVDGIGGEFKAYDEQGKFLGMSAGPPYYDPETKKLELFKL